MSMVHWEKLAKRPLTAYCPFAPIGGIVIACSLPTCNGCPIVEEYNQREEKRNNPNGIRLCLGTYGKLDCCLPDCVGCPVLEPVKEIE